MTSTFKKCRVIFNIVLVIMLQVLCIYIIYRMSTTSISGFLNTIPIWMVFILGISFQINEIKFLKGKINMTIRDDVVEKATITISISEYESLKSEAFKVQCLENAGVDNWNGYSEAMQEFYAEREDD